MSNEMYSDLERDLYNAIREFEEETGRQPTETEVEEMKSSLLGEDVVFDTAIIDPSFDTDDSLHVPEYE